MAVVQGITGKTAGGIEVLSQRERHQENHKVSRFATSVEKATCRARPRQSDQAAVGARYQQVWSGQRGCNKGSWTNYLSDRGVIPSPRITTGVTALMRVKQPLKHILSATRDYWDRPESRPAVRQNFERMINCRTPALGAEVYASESEEKLVYHTCKSRACPSCGHRATTQWQRETWCALPDIPYTGIVLTMPDVLWPTLQQNRHLLHDLAALGAGVIEQWVTAKYGVRVLIMVVQHTFGRSLNFNPHLHILVSAGGLQESEGRWIAPLRFEKEALMRMWRYAVITTS